MPLILEPQVLSPNEPEVAPAVSGVEGLALQNQLQAARFHFQWKQIEQFLPHYLDLENFLALPADWNGYGAEPPNHAAIEFALQALDILFEMGLEPTKLAPSVENGVGISFLVGNRYADIEILNDGEILAVISCDSGEPEVWNVHAIKSSIRNTLCRIRDFLYGSTNSDDS